jgi:Tol biopolymer transport system component
VFWVNEGFLMARAFSPDDLAFTGDAFAVGEGVVVQSDTWLASFAVSEAGPIAFQTGLPPERSLTWYDRKGEVLGTVGDPAEYGFIRLSPDDRYLAATLVDPGSGGEDVWIFDLGRNVGSRLTFDDANDTNPIWSPDGRRVAFSSTRDGVNGIYVRSSNGRGSAELLHATPERGTTTDWSPDGKYIAFNSAVAKSDLWILSLDGGEAESFIAGEFDEGYARFSPDSSWLAYLSNESGRYQLYVTRFPSGEGKWQLSKSGADWLLGWNEAGSELYYIDLEASLCSVRVELSDQVVADLPTCMFPTQVDRTWDATSDGERFVLGVPDEETTGFPITLVLNWRGER